MNKVIALDIGGVCMHLHPEKTIQYFGWSQQQIPSHDVLEAVVKYECGAISETDFLTLMHGKTENRFSDAELIYGYNLILGDAIEGMPETVQEICDLGFRFIFFSDTSNIHLLEIYRKLPFANLVSGGIFSFEVGQQKPHTDMYRAFEATYGKPCFYIDDKPGNIDGGRQHGWNSLCFTDVTSFRDSFFAMHKKNSF